MVIVKRGSGGGVVGGVYNLHSSMVIVKPKNTAKVKRDIAVFTFQYGYSKTLDCDVAHVVDNHLHSSMVIVKLHLRII